MHYTWKLDRYPFVRVTLFETLYYIYRKCHCSLWEKKTHVLGFYFLSSQILMWIIAQPPQLPSGQWTSHSHFTRATHNNTKCDKVLGLNNRSASISSAMNDGIKSFSYLKFKHWKVDSFKIIIFVKSAFSSQFQGSVIPKSEICF